MNNWTPLSSVPAWHVLLLVAPAVLGALTAVMAASSRSTAFAWRVAGIAAPLAVAAAAASLFAVASGSRGTALGLRADGLGGVVLLLATVVGWVIVRYSRPYLAGQRRERHYVRWLAATLGSVTLVLVADHLVVLVAAWTATSLALHQLLTFFADRVPARIAAHKKFLVARAADVCMITAIALLGGTYGTLGLAEVVHEATASDVLPVATQVAIVLVAITALLKCAQLPFHGWLIQVMEAPTPVSALLHAGVVNLGGFVLLRFAPLVEHTPAAQGLLVIVGTTTAVLAALVMTTRISVKVMLAWSTCAQMGFMLVECGLGLWEMALLHYVAHSLYKAHAFLAAGGAVRQSTRTRMAPPEAPPSVASLLIAVVIGSATTALAALACAPWLHVSAPLVVLAGMLALAMTPLTRPRGRGLDLGWLAVNAGGAFAVALAWFALHAVLAGRVVPGVGPAVAPWWLVVAGGLVVLFAIQLIVQISPRGALAKLLYPWIYGGLFLDERVSGIVFRVWPVPPVSSPIRSGALS